MNDTYQAPTALELRAALYALVTVIESSKFSGKEGPHFTGGPELTHAVAGANALLRGEQHERMVALVLSTSHLLQKTMENLEAAEDRARLVWRHGVIVFVPEINDEETDDLAIVFDYCRKHGYRWARFDDEGPQLADLPTYEWR